MAIDGRWTVTVSSPMGPLESELEVTSNGGTLTGTQKASGDERQIYNGTANGNEVSWSVDISQPIPATLTFTGSVEGDTLQGSVQAGMFGAFPFSGSRIG